MRRTKISNFTVSIVFIQRRPCANYGYFSSTVYIFISSPIIINMYHVVKCWNRRRQWFKKNIWKWSSYEGSWK